MANKFVGDHRRGRTRYQPLVDYLAACSEAEIVLTFPMIEAILGRPLPPDACVTIGFWTSPARIYVSRWQALGWRATLDRRNRCVVFTRDTGE
jgi:hypothetical protein